MMEYLIAGLVASGILTLVSIAAYFFAALVLLLKE
jgi:hypothetical protein